MNGWLLDTNVIAEVSGAKPDRRVGKWIASQPEHMLFLSILTIAEYQKGIHHLAAETGAVPACNNRSLRWKPDSPDGFCPFPTRLRCAGRQSRRGQAPHRAHFPSVIDTLLAATAIEHAFTWQPGTSLT